jgi:hypothetical protein
MSTTQTTPAPSTIEISKSKSVFDLDSKADVSVIKVGQFTPVTTMQEFVERLGNDSAAILKVVNDGLIAFATEQLATANDVPWKVVDDEGNPGADFNGTLLSEEKTKQLGATVLNIAKMMFGYPDVPRGTKQTPAELAANRAKKSEAKQAAIDFVLSNPAAVEALKK